MSNFYKYEPTLENFWRSIVLFGKNTASYKFALAKTLIELDISTSDFIKLEDLAEPYSKHICSHLKHSNKQTTNPSSTFINACKKFNENNISLDSLIEVTKKEGFKYVLDRFHIVNNSPLPRQFYISENKNIRLTDDFYKLVNSEHNENFLNEIEARWNLVETGWELGISANHLQIEYDEDQQSFCANTANKRKSVTSVKNALNGYQKGKCFYCYKYISTLKSSAFLCDVDHFFPHILKSKNFDGYLDGIWNLVLSCKDCNRGENGKFAKVPSILMLEKLYIRNEYLYSDHHLLRETIIQQLGDNSKMRRSNLQKLHEQAAAILIHEWNPIQNEDYKNF